MRVPDRLLRTQRRRACPLSSPPMAAGRPDEPPQLLEPSGARGLRSWRAARSPRPWRGVGYLAEVEGCFSTVLKPGQAVSAFVRASPTLAAPASCGSSSPPKRFLQFVDEFKRVARTQLIWIDLLQPPGDCRFIRGRRRGASGGRGKQRQAFKKTA